MDKRAELDELRARRAAEEKVIKLLCFPSAFGSGQTWLRDSPCSVLFRLDCSPMVIWTYLGAFRARKLISYARNAYNIRRTDHQVHRRK